MQSHRLQTTEDSRTGVLSPLIEFLRRHAPFDQMQPQHLEFMAKRLRAAFYANGEKITDPEAGPASKFVIIKQGRVRGETPSEDERISGNAWELMPGECFPIGALLARRPVRTVHRAVEDTFCYELEREDFDKLLKQSSVFSDFCTRRLSSLLEQVQQQVRAQAMHHLGGDTPLNLQVRECIRREPVSCPPDTPIGKALEVMQANHVGSVIITDPQQRPIGVFTLHDLLSRVALPRVPLERPIEEVMTPDPVTVPGGAFAFEAAMVMAERGFGHLCVVHRGRLCGVLSERDIFSLQRVGLVSLSRSIGRAADINELAALARDIPPFVGQLIAQGVKSEHIAQIITLLNDRITRRVIQLCTEAHGDPGIVYTWLSFGSEGRREQTLKTDQDNGILFEVPEGMSAEQVRQALLPLARRINEGLDACGFPLCPGNIMASNPECCLSLEEWQQRFARWIDQGTPAHLLKSTIFFDFRPLYGPKAPAQALRRWLNEHARPNSRFRRQLAANALRNRPPLGLIRDFKVASSGKHAHTLDLKANGVTPFVDAARILALAHGIDETNTVARLQAAAQAGGLSRADAAAYVSAYHYIQLLRMRTHQEQARRGAPMSNHVDPDSLNELDRRILKEAFRQARKIQSKLSLDYQL